MAISHVRDAFNTAAGGRATAERAFLSYERSHDVEWQVLHFQGAYSDGTPLDFKRQCRPGSNPDTEAALAAQDAIKQKEPK